MKYRNVLIAFYAAMAVSLGVVADDLDPAVPADETTAEEQPAPDRKDTFGARVSAEAKKARAGTMEDGTKFGEWVSSQKRQDAEHRTSRIRVGREKPRTTQPVSPAGRIR
jgi:hypothetical protein